MFLESQFSSTGLFVVVVESISLVQLFVTPWTAAHQTSPTFTISWNLLKLMSVESMMPSNHLILGHPLFLLPFIFPSIRVFSNESALHIKWPNFWSINFSISPSNGYSEFISFRIGSFGLLAVLWPICLPVCCYHAVLITVALCIFFWRSIRAHQVIPMYSHHCSLLV